MIRITKKFERIDSILKIETLKKKNVFEIGIFLLATMVANSLISPKFNSHSTISPPTPHDLRNQTNNELNT